MGQYNFTDPFEVLPALERTIIRLRANEMALVLYFAEELKFSILDMIQNREAFLARLPSGKPPRINVDTKRKVEKALKLMVADGAISSEERKMVETFFTFRNDIGHRVDHLFADLEQSRFSTNTLTDEKRSHFKIKSFDHSAIDQMKAIDEVLSRIRRSHYRFGTYKIRGHALFSSSKKVLEIENRALIKRIGKLLQQRQKDVTILSAEIEKGHELQAKFHNKGYFQLRHDGGRMTSIGRDFCFYLFETGLSDLAIAHLLKMKLRAIRLSRKKWLDDCP